MVGLKDLAAQFWDPSLLACRLRLNRRLFRFVLARPDASVVIDVILRADIARAPLVAIMSRELRTHQLSNTPLLWDMLLSCGTVRARI